MGAPGMEHNPNSVWLGKMSFTSTRAGQLWSMPSTIANRGQNSIGEMHVLSAFAMADSSVR